ncbi:hypothetical protein ANTQUA_LOCUS8440 [Anthophora quadrimaculata]
MRPPKRSLFLTEQQLTEENSSILPHTPACKIKEICPSCHRLLIFISINMTRKLKSKLNLKRLRKRNIDNFAFKLSQQNSIRKIIVYSSLTLF